MHLFSLNCQWHSWSLKTLLSRLFFQWKIWSAILYIQYYTQSVIIDSYHKSLTNANKYFRRLTVGPTSFFPLYLNHLWHNHSIVTKSCHSTFMLMISKSSFYYIIQILIILWHFFSQHLIEFTPINVHHYSPSFLSTTDFARRPWVRRLR